MSITASRITSSGTLFISGEFDEVTINGGAVAKRETSTGVILVSNEFNEVDKPV